MQCQLAGQTEMEMEMEMEMEIKGGIDGDSTRHVEL